MDSERDLLVTITSPEPELLASAQALHAELEESSDRPNRQLLMELGEVLFRIAFPLAEAVDDLAHRLAVAAQAPGTKPLRLWLHATQPDLGRLPWEYLCLTEGAVACCRRAGLDMSKHEPHTTNPTRQTFVALHPGVSLVRAAERQRRHARLERLGKLRVLIAWANPGPCEDGSGWPHIEGLAREVEAIENALRGLKPGFVEWKVLARANRGSLQKEMSAWKPHVLHFAGHGAYPGAFDDLGDVEEPALVLELKKLTLKRRHDYLNAEELRAWCAAAETLVVVLNSCWGARSGPNFPGIAQALVAAEPGPGVPVVVAHQFPILQTCAVRFPLLFYENIADALGVEEAVDTFRQDLVCNSMHGHFDPGWGVPVVFLGVEDSHLFRTMQADPYPMNFRAILQQYADQVPRPFLRAKVDAFLQRPAGGIFHLVAAPGTGKTAFLARWVHDDPKVVHFFYRATSGTTNPDECMNGVYDGLRARYGLVEEKNAGGQQSSPRRRLDNLLEHVSAECQRRGRKEVILIDALDEAGRSPSDRKSAAEVLPADLPPHVFLVVTSRPGPEADKLRLRPDVEQYVLDQDSPELQHDLAVFAARELAGRVADAEPQTIERISALLAARVRANFLILKCFLRRVLEGGPLPINRLEAAARELTDSVEEEYDRYFDKLRLDVTAAEMESVFKMLGAFAFSFSPITQEMVCGAFALSSWHWQMGFNHLCQFLERGGIRQAERGAQTYRLYHQTFQEYLNKKLATDRVQVQRTWADYGLGWRKLKDYPRLYALRHLPRHLLEASKES